MKKRTAIFSAVILAVAAGAATLITKRRLEEYKQSEEHKNDSENDFENDIEDACTSEKEYDYEIYSFEDSESMNRARLSGNFTVFSYYEFDDVSYLVIILDGREIHMPYYGGRKLDEEELEEFLERTNIETTYFIFEDEETFNEFLKYALIITQKNVKIPAVFYDDCIYADLGVFEEQDYERIFCMASECLGIPITDVYIAEKLGFLFDSIKK